MNEFYFFKKDDFSKHLEFIGAPYANASPYPHVVIDNFLPPLVAEELLYHFPPASFSGYEQPDINGFQEKKLGRLQNTNFKGVNYLIRHYLNEFNGKVFLDFLEHLTGIQGLIPDPHFEGGALHQTLSGGKLELHVDFNKDSRRHLDRRLNVLIYLNKNWDSAFGGSLELWDDKLARCVQAIEPIFNRCVVFSTGAKTYHGHPTPLQCPSEITRKSIALYYYTAQNVGMSDEAHSTIWKGQDAQYSSNGIIKRIKKIWNSILHK